MAETEDRVCKAILVVLFLGYLAGMIYMVVEGVNISNSSDKYADSSTKENCYLFEYERSTYCKNSQAVYSYHAHAFDKCANVTLYSEYDECAEEPLDLEQEKSCFVLDCDEQRFTFKEPEDVSSDGATYIAIGVIFLLLPFVGGLGAYIYRVKKQNN
eukprot:UN02848